MGEQPRNNGNNWAEDFIGRREADIPNMSDDRENFMRDFFNKNMDYFHDDRDRATFRRYLEEGRIGKNEVYTFLRVYEQGAEAIQIYLKEREEALARHGQETAPTEEEPEIYPLNKQESEKPEEADQKTAA